MRKNEKKKLRGETSEIERAREGEKAGKRQEKEWKDSMMAAAPGPAHRASIGRDVKAEAPWWGSSLSRLGVAISSSLAARTVFSRGTLILFVSIYHCLHPLSFFV